MKTSLVSVTFRKKTMEEIVELTKKAGLDAIEWGGDCHVLPTDPAAAAKALKLCEENGLEISAYGSYYGKLPDHDFADVLETAIALKTPIIRIWAGWFGGHSSNCSPEDRARFTADIKKAVEMAAQKGVMVATEFHPNTLTDNIDSALQLLEDVPGLYTYWQPRYTQSIEECLSDIRRLGKKCVNVHIFQRNAENKKAPLAEGKEKWAACLAEVKAVTDTRYVGMEFVMGDTEEQYLIDAELVKELVGTL